MFKGLKEFWNTPTSILIIKLGLVIGTVTLCLLSIFVHGILLGYGMIGVGLLVITLGIESKMRNKKSLTLMISIATAIIFFAIAQYIFTSPFI